MLGVRGGCVYAGGERWCWWCGGVWRWCWWCGGVWRWCWWWWRWCGGVWRWCGGVCLVVCLVVCVCVWWCVFFFSFSHHPLLLSRTCNSSSVMTVLVDVLVLSTHTHTITHISHQSYVLLMGVGGWLCGGF